MALNSGTCTLQFLSDSQELNWNRSNKQTFVFLSQTFREYSVLFVCEAKSSSLFPLVEFHFVKHGEKRDKGCYSYAWNC